MPRNNKRPEVAIGHIVMHVSDLEKSTEFYLQLGLRQVAMEPGMSILELLGGTHILFIDDEGMEAKLTGIEDRGEVTDTGLERRF